MSKKTSDMRTQSSNPLAGKNELANLQRDNSGSNAGKSAVNIMAQKLAKQNAQVEPQLFDAKARTIAGVPFTDWSLDIPNTVTKEQFDQLVDVLFSLDGRLQIYIGDMLNAMDDLEYGGIAALAEKYHRDPDTFYRLKSVMKSVTIFRRRKIYSKVGSYKKTLTASHYELVAPMDADDQERFLIVALEKGMSVSALKEYIDKETAPPKLPIVRRTDFEILDDTRLEADKKFNGLDTKREKQTQVDEWQALIDKWRKQL